MGDFDRREAATSPKSQNKQVAIAISLGVFLIGVLGYHFMKKGPQQAMGAEGDGPIPVVLEDTPEHASETLLKSNPYNGILTGAPSTGAELKPPHNPFIMDRQWVYDITHHDEVRAPTTQAGAVEPVWTPQTRPAPVKLAVKLENYKLGSIVRNQGQKFMAIINGQIVSAGAILDSGAKVIDIQADRVILQHPDFPDGPKSELKMDRKLN